MSSTVTKTNKFNSDVLFNIVCFGFIAFAGILLNILLVKWYNKNALGVFNQAYAVYLLLSQLAVAGIHLSVQYYTPKHYTNKTTVAEILQAALFTSTVSSIITIALGYASAGILGHWLDSKNVETGIVYCTWGLLFFSWNKILISILNGERKMKAFAVFQVLRFVFMLLFFAIMVKLKYHYKYAPLILALSEAALFVLLFVYCIAYFKPLPYTQLKPYIKHHIAFGKRATVGNLLLDVNTKVDIFILGVFQTDAMVGIYSFAASIAEGFALFPALLRNNINPVITIAHNKNVPGLLTRVFKRTRKAFYKLIGAMALFSMLAYPLVPYVFGFPDWQSTWIVYCILVTGILCTAGYQPYVMFFNQIGKPNEQTLFIFLIFLSNVVFNLALVPWLNIYGSAIGTALSFIFQMFLFVYMTRKILT